MIEPAVPTVCMNIGPAQRRLRYQSAVGFAIAVVIIDGILIALGAPHRWRLLVAIPIWLSAFSYLEAHHKTCVALASHDEESMDDGLVLSKTLRGDKVQDDNLKKALHEKSRKIILQVLAITIPLTALLTLIP